MAYAPQDVTTLRPWMAGDDAGWAALSDNHDECYETYGPPIVSSALDADATSATAVTLAKFYLLENTDNEDVTVRVHCKGSSSGGTLTIEIDNDSTFDSNTGAIGTSYAWVSVTVTPTGSATDREVRVRVSHSSPDQVFIRAVVAYVAPAAPGSGVLSSGFARADAQWYAAGEPVPSERISRGYNGPPAIAKDRPATLVSVLDDVTATSTRAQYQTASTDAEEVFRFQVPQPDTVERDYTMIAVFDISGTATMSAVVYIGQTATSTTSTGKLKATVTLSPGVTWGRVTLQQTGGTGSVFLRTFQLAREPA